MTHKVLELYVNGTQNLRDATTQEIADMQTRTNGAFDRAMEDLRSLRDARLASCDWTQMPDVSLNDSTQTEWQTYRQALRDITNGLTTVEQVKAVVWPEKPGA